jgi:hypothetical protein
MFLFLFIVVVNVVIVAVATIVLLRKLPANLKQLPQLNSRRLDGTTSSRRRWIELKWRFDFISNIAFGCFLCLVPLNGLVWLLHHFVIPLPMIASAFAKFSPMPRVWEERLEASHLGQEHSEWFAGSSSVAHDIQELLWVAWPAIAVVLVIVFLTGVRWFAKYHLAAVAEYGAGLISRREEYLRYDVDRLRYSNNDAALGTEK